MTKRCVHLDDGRDGDFYVVGCYLGDEKYCPKTRGKCKPTKYCWQVRKERGEKV